MPDGRLTLCIPFFIGVTDSLECHVRPRPTSLTAGRKGLIATARWKGSSGRSGGDVPPEVLDKVERFLAADGDRIFRVWFGERGYKKHFNLATFECAQGGIRSILDYVRREG